MTAETTIVYKTTSGKTFSNIVQCVKTEIKETNMQHFIYDNKGEPNYDLRDALVIIVDSPKVRELVDMLVYDYMKSNAQWQFPNYGVYIWDKFEAEWNLIKSFAK